MRPSTNFTLFAAALSLYLAPFALAAEHPQQEHVVRSLNDQNLFEAHLHAHAGSSHKRLPSEVLQQHHEHERDVAPASSSSTEAAALATSTAPVKKHNIPFSARQPSHFIKAYKKQGKRRLSVPSHYERDGDDLAAVWSLPAVVSQAFTQEQSSTTEASSATIDKAVHTDGEFAQSRSIRSWSSTKHRLTTLLPF